MHMHSKKKKKKARVQVWGGLVTGGMVYKMGEVEKSKFM